VQYVGQPIRVLTVDDHPLLREGIAAVVKRQPDMQIVGEACNGLEAITQFRLLKPDVTLMDLQMPEMDGVEAIAAIRADCAQARILVLTTYKGDALSWRALKAGAVGYLLKSSLRTDLLEAIRVAHGGGRWIPAEIAQELASHAGEESLTAREIEVLQRIAAGNSNREVGAMLSLSEETIKARMKSILAKLSAKDRTHAVSIALKRGLIQP
jgi:two-component system, NarL family, response regulator